MCALRRYLFELLEAQFGIAAPVSPSSDVQATASLRTIIFHWEAIPRIVQFVYRILRVWCRKDTVEVLPEDLFSVADSDHDFEQVDRGDDYGATDKKDRPLGLRELAERLAQIIEEANEKVVPLCRMIRKVCFTLYILILPVFSITIY
jgi:hypothetical protein